MLQAAFCCPVAVSAIIIVMCVGLAVDPAVHFTHFYNEATGNRFEKTQAALHGVGVSVIGGAVTTAAAAIPLMTSPHAQSFYEASPLALQPYTYIRRCGPYVCICSFRGISNQMRHDARMMHLEFRCSRGPLYMPTCTCPHAFTI